MKLYKINNNITIRNLQWKKKVINLLIFIKN